MEIGYIHHGTASGPFSTERVHVRHICLDQYKAFFEGRWRKVYVGVKMTYIIYKEEKLKIQIEGLEAPTMTQQKERLAFESVSTPAKLKQRLASAKAVWSEASKERIRFDLSNIDFEHKRLVSDCGGYVLQWQLRDNPAMPESYANQQTTVGVVRFFTYKGKNK